MPIPAKHAVAKETGVDNPQEIMVMAGVPEGGFFFRELIKMKSY